jgi:uncharacterized protein YlxW (UPF0749 family)
MDKKIVHYNKENIFIDTDVSKKYIDLVNKIEKLQKELKPLETQLETELMTVMTKLGKKEVINSGIVAKIKDAYIRNSLDTTRLKEEDIETYKKYLKSTEVASKISISIDR